MNRLFQRLLAGVCCAVFMSGCGAPRFDGSSAAASAKSFQSLTAGMTDAQRNVFMARATAVSSLVRPGGGAAPTADTMWNGIHGMTRAEIEAKANEMLPTKIPPTGQ